MSYEQKSWWCRYVADTYKTGCAQQDTIFCCGFFYGLKESNIEFYDCTTFLLLFIYFFFLIKILMCTVALKHCISHWPHNSQFFFMISIQTIKNNQKYTFWQRQTSLTIYLNLIFWGVELFRKKKLIFDNCRIKKSFALTIHILHCTVALKSHMMWLLCSIVPFHKCIAIKHHKNMSR